MKPEHTKHKATERFPMCVILENSLVHSRYKTHLQEVIHMFLFKFAPDNS